MKDKNTEYPISTAGMRYFRPNYAQLMSELQKYVDLGNLVDAVKEYKEKETPLDIQLREFKKQQNNE